MTQNTQDPIDPALLAKGQEMKPGETAVVIGAPQTTAVHPEVPETLKTTETKTPDGVAIKSPLDIMGTIAIRPFIEEGVENMGLENYGFVVFPGTTHTVQLACIERNGTLKYITGLDEFAPEISSMKDKAQKEAVIKNIRLLVSDLEEKLEYNKVSPDDPDFWNKVVRLKPNNQEFWETVEISCGNEPVFLNPKNDPMDLVLLMAIEAGGFDNIAKSYEDARARSVAPKWYLDKEVDTVKTRIEHKRLRNQATVLLEKLFLDDPRRMMYVAKLTNPDGVRYKYTTPPAVLYDHLDNYIQGEGPEKSRAKAAELFIKNAELDMETLKIKSIIKDAVFYNFISLSYDGTYKHAKSGETLGKTLNDITERLKTPMFADTLSELLDQVEQYWKQ